jgi:WD40 repeat protein
MKSPCLDLLAPPQEEPHTENLGSADLSPDGEFAVVIDEQQARVWDFRAGQMIHSFPKASDQWLSAKFAPNSHKLWVCGWSHELTGYDVLGKSTATPPTLGFGNLLREISRDGSMLVLSNNGLGEFIVAWPATGKKLRLKHPGNLATALSPDGAWLVTTSYQKPGARIWSLPDGKLQHTLCQSDTVMQTIITPDSQRLIMQTSGGNRLFRTSDWTEQNTLPQKLRLTSMAVSPDGRYLATIGDNAVHLLHTDTFTQAFHLTLPDHVGWLGDAHPVFDGDGSYLLIHTALGSVVRWDLRKMEVELVKIGMGL